MKFLVDAQLPRRLVRRLRDAGFDAVHTLDLPDKNRTPDAQICSISLVEERVVITKDVDFVDSLILRGEPWKLLLVSTGNIGNRDLEALILGGLEGLAEMFSTCSYIEISRTALIVHL